MIGRFWKVVYCFLMLLAIEPAFAELPFITDDPEVPGLGKSELFLFGTKIRTEPGTDIFLPMIEYNYGLLDSLELTLLGGIVTSEPKASGESNATGYTDTEIALKWQIIKETDCLPSVALNPTYILPTGNDRRGLGNGRGFYFLPIWLQKSWDKWTSYGGFGRTINAAKGEKHFWFGGIVVQREINDKWTLGAELFAQADEATDEKSFVLLNVGGYYFFTESFALLFSAGPTIKGANNFYAFLGLSWEWGGNEKEGENGKEKGKEKIKPT